MSELGHFHLTRCYSFLASGGGGYIYVDCTLNSNVGAFIH